MMFKKHPSKACRLRVGLNFTLGGGGGGGGAPIPTITPLHPAYFIPRTRSASGVK